MSKVLTQNAAMKRLRVKYGFEVEDLFPFAVELLNGAKQYGYASSDGDIVVAPQFDEAYPFIGDLAIVKADGMYGVINYFGDWVIEPKYSSIESFSNKETDFFIREGEKGKVVTIVKKYDADCPEFTVEILRDNVSCSGKKRT